MRDSAVSARAPQVELRPHHTRLVGCVDKSEPQVAYQADHSFILCKYVTEHCFQSPGTGNSNKVSHDLGGDALSLPGIGNNDRELAAGPVCLREEPPNRDLLCIAPSVRDRDQGHVPLIIDISEITDHPLRRTTNSPHEAHVTGLRAERLDEVALEFRICGPNRPNRNHFPGSQGMLPDEFCRIVLLRSRCTHIVRCSGTRLMTTAYITHPDCLLHDPGVNHPESGRRLSAIHDALHAAGLFDLLQHHEAPEAGLDELLLAHSRRQLHMLEANEPGEGFFEIDADTRMNPGTLRAARRAVGAVVRGVDLVTEEMADNAFCAVRPPGHHAERNRAMGFCFFNNVAIGALYALERPGVDRVAVLDFDAHFGNGTEAILANHDAVLICSTFQHPLFPSEAYVQADKNPTDVALDAGSGSSAFRTAVTQRWRPAIEAFRPDLILVSAGFDAHAADPLADLRFTVDDYGWVTRLIAELARRCCNGRVVSSLEGGYHLNALGRCATAHIRALMGLV